MWSWNENRNSTVIRNWNEVFLFTQALMDWILNLEICVGSIFWIESCKLPRKFNNSQQIFRRVSDILSRGQYTTLCNWLLLRHILFADNSRLCFADSSLPCLRHYCHPQHSAQVVLQQTRTEKASYCWSFPSCWWWQWQEEGGGGGTVAGENYWALLLASLFDAPGMLEKSTRD